MQVSFQSINADSITAKLMYYIYNEDNNPLGSEGVFHLSKGKWKNFEIIYLGNATFTKMKQG
jgi:hypothetical protein